MSPPRKPKKPKEPEGITRITVKGFKSLANETSIDIRPLTILAGANSSGKSSIMQPLLLLKQTLEAPYDPGGLKLDGPHVEATGVHQVLSQVGQADMPPLVVELEGGPGDSLCLAYAVDSRRGLTVYEVCVKEDGCTHCLRPDMTHSEIEAALPDSASTLARGVPQDGERREWRAGGDRGFLRLRYAVPGHPATAVGTSVEFRLDLGVSDALQRILHVPRLRGLQGRAYPQTATGPLFPGTFEAYTGSLILHWQGSDAERLDGVVRGLRLAELADGVEARQRDATSIEVFVPIRPARGPRAETAMANIADVGSSVSHALPAIVALQAAEPGRLVYIEQPEIHLHPRAQVALAQVLVEAANRGVRVVAETHSSLLLVAVQTLVAKQRIAKEDLALHWFARNRQTGVTRVRTARVTGTGSFGPWPEDFSDVELRAHAAYLDAAHEQRKAG
jgi:hypothetical protein